MSKLTTTALPRYKKLQQGLELLAHHNPREGNVVPLRQVSRGVGGEFLVKAWGKKSENCKKLHHLTSLCKFEPEWRSIKLDKYNKRHRGY